MWGNVPKGQKGKASFKNGGQAALLNRDIDEMVLKSKRNKQSAVRRSKNKETSGKLQSKKHSSAIRTTQPPANSTQADSEAILPNRMQLVFLRALFHMKHFPWNTTRIRFGKAGAHPQLALGIAIAPETLSFITTF